jgi:hypothetical protein
MNADAKKTALRAIPYGSYVLTADDGAYGAPEMTVTEAYLGENVYDAG